MGRTLRGTGRRGKITLLDFGDVVGVIHLVISGRVLRLQAWREPDKIHTAVLEFEGGLVLAFTRLWLGYFNLYEPGTEEEHPLISRLGPEPFSEDFTSEYLAEQFARRPPSRASCSTSPWSPASATSTSTRSSSRRASTPRARRTP